MKITCLIIVHIISLNGRLEVWNRKNSTILNILEVMLFAVEGGITVLVLWLSAFGSLKDWENFLALIIKQMFLKNKLRKFIVLFIVCMCFSTSLIITNGWIWATTIGFHNYKYYIVRDAEMFHNYAFFLFYVYIVVSVNNELKEVNDLLHEVVNGTEIKQEDNARKIIFIKLNHWSHNDMTQLTKRYRIIYEATESINTIFGWEILFFIGHAGVVLLNLLYGSVWLLDHGIFDDDETTALLCISAVVCLSTTVSNLRNYCN